MSIKSLLPAMEYLFPLVSETVATQRQRMRTARQKGELAIFPEGDYVLVARAHFQQGEKLCLR